MRYIAIIQVSIFLIYHGLSRCPVMSSYLMMSVTVMSRDSGFKLSGQLNTGDTEEPASYSGSLNPSLDLMCSSQRSGYYH
jgi:hypothetical protein